MKTYLVAALYEGDTPIKITADHFALTAEGMATFYDFHNDVIAAFRNVLWVRVEPAEPKP